MKIQYGFPVSAVWGAEYEDTVDSQKALFGFLPVTIILITLLLIAQFNSARRFLILILNVPFALSGVIVGLLLFRQSFGFVALMGMLALFGMLINIGMHEFPNPKVDLWLEFDRRYDVGDLTTGNVQTKSNTLLYRIDP